MTTESPTMLPLEVSLKKLWEEFVTEFLRAHGEDLDSIADLPVERHDALLREAAVYAGLRLAQIESRAHFFAEI